MNLFNTLIEAAKYTWNEKPMWKFILAYVVPPVAIICTLIYIFYVSYFQPFFTNEFSADFPQNILQTPDGIGMLVGISILWCFQLIMMLLIAAGSITHTWQHTNLSKNAEDLLPFEQSVKNTFWHIFVTKAIFFFIFLFVLAIFIAGYYFAIQMENIFLIVVMIITSIIVLPLIITIPIILPATFPIWINGEHSVKSFMNEAWDYGRSNFWQLVLAQIIIYVARMSVTTAVSFILQPVFLMLYVVLLAGIFLASLSPTITILLMLLMAIALGLFTALFAIITYLMHGLKYIYFTMIYDQVLQSADPTVQLSEENIIEKERFNETI